ncbi:Uncharacterized protein APZ42_028923 [Daphnia magna]|uniref:RNA-directed DNA polymerase n=1 Tax=Daphnia magna TaxID=35525 RepID=A0A164Q313_9CRUS|nr:Uncharacterized protein APZ42_028923 [Daphnia magna]
MMDLVLTGLRWTICLVYLDDIIIYVADAEEHLVRQVLTALRKAGLKIKLVKCQFGASEVKALGHIFSGDGVRPDPGKINAVENFPSPSTLCKPSEQLKCVRSFVGLCSYYRLFIPQFAHTAKPLTDMFKKGGCFVWEESQEVSFELMKQALVSAATLAYPDFTRPTGRTPFYLVYGREAVLPIDGALNADPNLVPPPDRDPSEWAVERLQQARLEVQAHAAAVQRKQKKGYEEGRREATTYLPGEEVLIYKPIRKVEKSEKLLHRWLGPYTVVRQAIPSNYELRLGRTVKTEIVHVERMKPFVDCVSIPTPERGAAVGSSSGVRGPEPRGVNRNSPADTPAARDGPSHATAIAPEGIGLRRSTRIRAPRKTFLLAFPLMFLLTVMSGPDIRVNAMSNHYDGVKSQIKQTLQQHVKEQEQEELLKLRKVHQRWNELKTAVGMQEYRVKRGLVNGGGRLLNWLLGVSTQEDLEQVNGQIKKLSTETTSIAHALEVHASLINETLSSISSINGEKQKRTLSVQSNSQNSLDDMSREDMITLIKDFKKERETLIQEKECIIKHTKEIESELTSIKIKIANMLLDRFFNDGQPTKTNEPPGGVDSQLGKSYVAAASKSVTIIAKLHLGVDTSNFNGDTMEEFFQSNSEYPTLQSLTKRDNIARFKFNNDADAKKAKQLMEADGKIKASVKFVSERKIEYPIAVFGTG